MYWHEMTGNYIQAVKSRLSKASQSSDIFVYSNIQQQIIATLNVYGVLISTCCNLVVAGTWWQIKDIAVPVRIIILRHVANLKVGYHLLPRNVYTIIFQFFFSYLDVYCIQCILYTLENKR